MVLSQNDDEAIRKFKPLETDPETRADRDIKLETRLNRYAEKTISYLQTASDKEAARIKYEAQQKIVADADTLPAEQTVPTKIDWFLKCQSKKVCLDLLHVIACEDFVGIGTPEPVIAMKVKTKKDALLTANRGSNVGLFGNYRIY